MTKDPIITEIRRFRDGYARRHGYSIRAIAEDLRRFQAQRPARTLAPHAKPARKVAD
jgi:hypothetical protein